MWLHTAVSRLPVLNLMPDRKTSLRTLRRKGDPVARTTRPSDATRYTLSESNANSSLDSASVWSSMGSNRRSPRRQAPTPGVASTQHAARSTECVTQGDAHRSSPAVPVARSARRRARGRSATSRRRGRARVVFTRASDARSQILNSPPSDESKLRVLSTWRRRRRRS